MNNSKITLKELKQIAKNRNLKNYSTLNKKELVKHLGGDGFLSRFGFSKSSPKIELNNGVGTYIPPSSKLPIATQINKVNIVSTPSIQSAIPLEVNVINVKNNSMNKINKLKQILNMNNSDATIYFSEDVIKKLIDFQLKIIKDNIQEIETIAQISAFIRYEDLLTVNKNSIDKMIADINASYLMKGTNYKLIQLTAILVKNLKDLRKLISIKNLKNNSLQKNINSFSSNELTNYREKVSRNMSLEKNTKKLQSKMKIYTNLQNRLKKIPKQNTVLVQEKTPPANSSRGITFRNNNGISSLTNVKYIPTRFERTYA